MRAIVSTAMAGLWILVTSAYGNVDEGVTSANWSVDEGHPIEVDGCTVRYGGKTYKLDEKCLFVDGKLTADEAAMCQWIFNDFNEAMRHLTDGTQQEPMQVLLAPWVYWVDDPDDPEVRVGIDGREPIGLTVKCENLHITGLNPDPRNVVIAAARGQTQGAVGNFTMIEFWGDGLEVRNLTMGNYCNVDLKYPLRPELGRDRRMSAITQAHVAYAHGDRILAENVRFISRLNMNPLSGGRRTLFDRCHFEMTDDALAPTGVYLHCSLDYYGAKPFWGTHPNGAVLLDCDLNMRNNNAEVYFCKGVGQVAAVNCRIHCDQPLYFGWTKYPPEWLRCYEYNTTLDDSKYSIGSHNPINTVGLAGLPLLNGYVINTPDTTVYNTYNLLCGDDGWDPLNVKHLCAGNTDIATSLIVSPREAQITTGTEPLTLTAQAYRHCGYPMDTDISWSIVSGEEGIVRIIPDGNACQVTGMNVSDEAKDVVIQATTPTGLQGAAVVTVKPTILPPPTFVTTPTMGISDGVATIDYALGASDSRDCTEITWMRVIGTDTIPIAVSRGGKPKTAYRLVPADLGHTIIADVRPKSARSEPGPVYRLSQPIHETTEILPSEYAIDMDFSDFPTIPQPKIIEGTWTVDCYKPADTAPYDWIPNASEPAWTYASGYNGARGIGLLQCQRGARLLYTPPQTPTSAKESYGTETSPSSDGPNEYGDMEVWLDVDPTKTGGQGFGSATGQYMDVYIKFDTRTLTGYALRIERTTKYSNAVDFSLVRYEGGVVTPITEPISSVCYRTGCHIHLRASGETLTASVDTDTPVSTTNPDLTTSVSLEAPITPNSYGGTGVQHTGTCGENTTMLHRLRAKFSTGFKAVEVDLEGTGG